jgi:hypothetical protein
MNVLILEFNELCPPLLTRFMKGGLLPNFSRLYSRSEIYTTTTDDEHLEPWVHWVTFHCGVRETMHGVHQQKLNLADASRLLLDRIVPTVRSSPINATSFAT